MLKNWLVIGRWYLLEETLLLNSKMYENILLVVICMLSSTKIVGSLISLHSHSISETKPNNLFEKC